ncbi:hypothetical protein AXG94_18785 [Pseudomonas corrugata]|nr:hypothetical protein AXG94_18785 [Pseudomonas corrugata]
MVHLLFALKVLIQGKTVQERAEKEGRTEREDMYEMSMRCAGWLTAGTVERGALVATRNTRDFEFSGIEIFNPWNA